MRKIVASAFISIDGVMQAPGGPDEDPSGGFKFGGWTPPYWDDALNAAMDEVMSEPFDLLLGRRTYDIFAAHWPHVQTDPAASDFDALNQHIATTFNSVTKYVATHAPQTLSWRNSAWLGEEVVAALRRLKGDDGPRLLVQGSTVLLRTLLAADLIDEMTLLVMPVVLGRGKRPFDEQSAPTAFRTARSSTSPSGVVITTYERQGAIASGNFGLETPTQEELDRRKSLTS